MRRLIVTSAVLAIQLGLVTGAGARVIEIYPSDATATCDEEFERVANTLQPGDELVLHGGVYTQSCRRAITVTGTAAQPITIRTADGEQPILTRPQPPDFNYPENNLEVFASHLVIRGLRFQGGDSGVVLNGQRITLEDCEIYETGNNALALRGNSDSFVIRRNHIHHTGLRALSAGTTEGEGMYIGCNRAACIASNHLIEGNYIHHLRGTSEGGNDGIEIKPGSFGNVVRNNVIHDTTIGQRYPCILVYGGGASINVVEGNVVWNCGEAIQVVADAVVQNNVVLSSEAGIVSYPHEQVAAMRRLTIVNNTLHGHAECLNLRWSSARDIVLANNALYCPGAVAVNARNVRQRSIAIVANYVEGTLDGVTLDAQRFLAGGPAAGAFVDVASRDFWPSASSPLRSAAAGPRAPRLDFNQTMRAAPYDVGAYETDGQAENPGWRIVAGFKPLPATGAADLRVVSVGGLPASVAVGGRVTVSDTTRNVGTAGAPASTTRYYLSVDPERGTGDRRLTGRRTVPALGPGEESAGSATIQVPAAAAPGVYFVLACADDRAAAAESVEAGNCLPSGSTITVLP